MAVKSCSLQIDMRLHEMVNRGTPMFPCGGYVLSVGDQFTQSIPWHWHEEAEVLVVCSGTLRVESPAHSFCVREGEGVFINSGVLHCAANVGECLCQIKSFVLHPGIISGAMQSIWEQRYVHPLQNCAELAAIHFGKEQAWHRQAVRSILTAFSHFQGEAYGYEFPVREALSRVWYLIAVNNQKVLLESRESKNHETMRAKEMLTFIHAHYPDPIDLRGIAKAASLSERECLRCFGKTLGITPMQYVLRHRISVAAGLLTSSDMNITEIARLAGFASPSYFSLMFKKMVEMTPREYRARAAEG